MLKWLDIPPVWLGMATAVVWMQANQVSGGLSFGETWRAPAGAVFIALGVMLIVAAVVEMLRQETTPVPHMQANHLVTSGVFAISRNPIYLGDLLILTGFILRWDAVLSIPLVFLLGWIIQTRFILAEESRLRDKFGPIFEQYRLNTRRWI